MPHSTQDSPFRSSDIVLLVTGLVGSGRSTFINALLPPSTPKMKVGDSGSISTCTTSVQHTIIDLSQYPDLGRTDRLVVVDTPGFDDSDRSDAEIMDEILSWLQNSFPSSNPSLKCKGGVIYLHDISKDRFQGVAEADMKVLDQSLNSNSDRYTRLIIATTKWYNFGLSPEECTKRHETLKTRWKRVVSSGSKVHAFKTNEDAWKIVKSFLPELDSGKALDFGEFAQLRGSSRRGLTPGKGSETWSKVLGRLVGILGMFGKERSR